LIHRLPERSGCKRGYVVCDVTRRRWRSEYKVVPFVAAPGAPISTRTTFTVLGDEPGLHEE